MKNTDSQNSGTKTFEVQVYQVHVATFHVHARNTAEAISNLMNGDGDELLDSPRYHSPCHERGIQATDCMLEKLDSLGVPYKDRTVSSIASVTELDPDEE